MNKYKKHKLVPSIYGVITLINTSIHHTATKLCLIFTPLIIYMFTISLQRIHNLFFSLAYCNLHAFEIRRFKMSFYLNKKFGKQSRHRVRSSVPPSHTTMRLRVLRRTIAPPSLISVYSVPNGGIGECSKLYVTLLWCKEPLSLDLTVTQVKTV